MRLRDLLVPMLCLAGLAPAASGSTALAAGSAEPPVASPAAPLAPTPEMQKVAFLLGSWKVSSKPAEGKGGVSGSDAVTLGPGGYSFIGNFRGTGPSGVLRGHSILAWDPEGRRYLSVWTDNLTQGASLSWGRWEGKDLVFEEPPAKGQTGTIRTIYFAITQDRYEWRMERRSPDGRTERLAAMVYDRASPP